MKNLIVIVTFLFTLFGCQPSKPKLVEGDLYFKLVDFRFFDIPDKELKKMETEINTVDKKTLTEQEKQFYDYLGFMSKNNLLRKPFVRLKLDNGKIIILFLEKKDYDSISNYNHQYLVGINKKIRIKAEVSELKYDSLTAYKTLKVLSINKIDGKTYWEK